MQRSIAAMALFLFASLGIGCATDNHLYYWGKYEKTLYRHYRSPDDMLELVGEIGTIVEKGEELGRIPPGLYAEYGYLLLELGESGRAAIFFEKEKATWPESTYFMDAMLRAMAKGLTPGLQNRGREKALEVPDAPSS